LFSGLELGRVKDMNREIRRMQEKADKKGDPGPRRRGPRKVAKSEKVKNTSPKSKPSKSQDNSGDSNKGTRRRGRLPNNRFTGILGLLTAFFIIMQSASLELVQKLNTSATTLDYVFHALSFLLFGYFVNLWLSRRGTVNALPICLIFGIALLAGVELSKWFNFNLPPNLILIGLAAVGLIAGMALARLVFRMSERYAS